MMLSSRASLAIAALVMGILATASTGSFADPVMSSPNTINDATHDARTVSPSTDTYDSEDPYRDQRVFPQLGWQYLPRLPR